MSEEIQHVILDEVRNIRAELHLHRTESYDRHDKIDVRVRQVESWQNNADGKITVIATVGVILGGFITWIGNKLFS